MSDISARYGRASMPRSGFTYVTTNNLPRVRGHRRPQSVGPEPHEKDFYLGSRLKWTTMPSTDYGAYEDSYTGFSSLGFRPHYRSTRSERIRAVDDAYRGLNRFEPPRLDPVPAIPKRRAYETPRYEPWIPASHTYSDYPLGTSYYLGRKRALDLGDEIANLYERNFRNRRYLHSQDTINDSKYALHKLRSGNLNTYPYLLPSRSGLGRDYVPEVTYQPSTSAFPYTYLRTRPTYFLEPIDWSRFTPRPVDFVPNRYLFVPIRVPRGGRGRRAASVGPGSNYYTVNDGRRARSVSRVRSPQRDVGHNIRAKALLDHTTPNYYHTHGYRPGQLPLDPDYPMGNRSSSMPRSTTVPSRRTESPSSYKPTPSADSGRGRPRAPAYEPTDRSSRKPQPSSYEPSSYDRPSRRTEPTSTTPATPASANEPYRRAAPIAEDDQPSRYAKKPSSRDVNERPTDTGRGRQPARDEEEPATTGRGRGAAKPAEDETPYVSRRHPTAAGEAETPSPDMALSRQKSKPTGDDEDANAATSPTDGTGGRGKPTPAGGAGRAAPKDDDDEGTGRPGTRTPPPSGAEDEDAEPIPAAPAGMDLDEPLAVLVDRRASRKEPAVPAGRGLLFDPDAEDNAGAPEDEAADAAPVAGADETPAADEEDVQPEDDAAAKAAARRPSKDNAGGPGARKGSGAGVGPNAPEPAGGRGGPAGKGAAAPDADRAGSGGKAPLGKTVSSGSAAGKKAQPDTKHNAEDDEERRGLGEEEMILEESADDNASRRRPGDYDERAIAKRSKTEQEQVTEKKDFTEEYEYEVRRETTAYEITETWEEQIEHAGYEEIVEAAADGEEIDGEFVEEEEQEEATPAAEETQPAEQEEEQQPEEEEAAPEAEEEQTEEQEAAEVEEEAAEGEEAEAAGGDEEEEPAPEEEAAEEEPAAEEEEEE